MLGEEGLGWGWSRNLSVTLGQEGLCSGRATSNAHISSPASSGSSWPPLGSMLAAT